jgi:hypothetical protein
MTTRKLGVLAAMALSCGGVPPPVAPRCPPSSQAGPPTPIGRPPGRSCRALLACDARGYTLIELIIGCLLLVLAIAVFRNLVRLLAGAAPRALWTLLVAAGLLVVVALVPWPRSRFAFASRLSEAVLTVLGLFMMAAAAWSALTTSAPATLAAVWLVVLYFVYGRLSATVLHAAAVTLLLRALIPLDAARTQLGLVYDQGIGVAPEPARAARWYRAGDAHNETDSSDALRDPRAAARARRARGSRPSSGSASCCGRDAGRRPTKPERPSGWREPRRTGAARVPEGLGRSSPRRSSG